MNKTPKHCRISSDLHISSWVRTAMSTCQEQKTSNALILKKHYYILVLMREGFWLDLSVIAMLHTSCFSPLPALHLKSKYFVEAPARPLRFHVCYVEVDVFVSRGSLRPLQNVSAPFNLPTLWSFGLGPLRQEWLRQMVCQFQSIVRCSWFSPKQQWGISSLTV